MTSTNFMVTITILIAFVLSAFSYPLLPDTIVTHWDGKGMPNGFLPKFWGAFLLPFLMIALTATFEYLPKIDPLKKNVKKFQSWYLGFLVVLNAFLLLVHASIIAWNLQLVSNIMPLVIAGLAGLFYYVGLLLQHTKQNWFLGVRTPWTLQSAKNWELTNQRAGKQFQWAAAIAVVGIPFPKLILVFVVLPVVLIAMDAFRYSYAIAKTSK